MKITNIPEEKLEIIRLAISENCPNIDRQSIVFLSGSFAEGLATPKSDFDVYIISELESSKDIANEIFISSKIGMIEINYVSTDKITKIANKIDACDIDRNELSAYDLILAHRVINGISLVNEEQLGILKKKINPILLAKYISDINFGIAAKCLSDAIGNLQILDYDSAIFNATRGVHHTLDHLLATYGNTSTLFKWRSRYARNILGEESEIYVTYKYLTSCVPTESTYAKKIYVENAFRFFQSVSDFSLAKEKFPFIKVQLLGTRLWGSDYTAPLKSPLRKTPCSYIQRKNGKYFLVNLVPLFEVSIEVVAIWLIIDNERTLEEITSLLLMPDFSCLELSEQKIASYIKKLKSLHVVF